MHTLGSSENNPVSATTQKVTILPFSDYESPMLSGSFFQGGMLY